MVGCRPAMDRMLAVLHRLDRGIHRFHLYQPSNGFPVAYFQATTKLQCSFNIQIYYEILFI